MQDKYIIIIIIIPILIGLFYFENKINSLENRIQELEKESNNEDFEHDDE